MLNDWAVTTQVVQSIFHNIGSVKLADNTVVYSVHATTVAQVTVNTLQVTSQPFSCIVNNWVSDNCCTCGTNHINQITVSTTSCHAGV